jgi:hypothetical protein
LTPKTIKRLHRTDGLPLVRFNGGGPYFCFWTDLERWARQKHAAK